MLCFMFHSRQDFSQARNDGNRHLLFYVLLTTEILPIRIEFGKEDISKSATREGTPEESGISSSEVSRDEDIAGRVSGSGVAIIIDSSSCLLDPERIAGRIELREEDIITSTTREGTPEDIGTSS